MTGKANSLATLVAAAARDRPQGVAMLTPAGAVSREELVRRLAGMAHTLLQAGLHPGERVAILAGMGPFAVEMLGALSWAGLVAVPLNSRLSPVEQQAICTQAGVAALVHEEETLPPELSALPVRFLPARQLATSSGAAALHLPGRHALAALVFTSGTTGKPKGVILNNAALALHGETVCRWLRYSPQDRVLQSQPLFHVAGINQLYAVIMAGATLVFAGQQGMDGITEAIAGFGATAIGLVPTTLAMLLDRVEEGIRLPSLRSIVYGAAPITSGLLGRARELLPKVAFSQFYGQTETGPTTALLPEDHDSADEKRLRSCGRPRPGLALRIVTPDGRACGTGKVGEVQFQGTGLTEGYWRDAKQTAALFSDGWLRSGDLGFLDGDGYLTIVDRLKDMIVTGGENVYGAEVEEVLARHPAVAEVAVVGLPDARWGEAVHAVVVVAKNVPPPTAEELAAFCRGRIAGYKIPRHIHFRAEEMPLTAVGKVEKTSLRQWIVAHAPEG